MLQVMIHSLKTLAVPTKKTDHIHHYNILYLCKYMIHEYRIQ